MKRYVPSWAYWGTVAVLYGTGVLAGEYLAAGTRMGSITVVANYPSALLAGWVATLGVRIGFPSPSDAASLVLLLLCNFVLGAVLAKAFAKRRRSRRPGRRSVY